MRKNINLLISAPQASGAMYAFCKSANLYFSYSNIRSVTFLYIFVEMAIADAKTLLFSDFLRFLSRE